MTKNADSAAALPPTAQYARAILSLTFGWVLLRGFQLRGDLLSPPPADDEMMHFGDFLSSSNVGSTTSRQLRGLTSSSSSSDDASKKHSPATTTAATGSAACLFIQKGDFHLSDWLAYHTFMAPLDYVVVATDGPDTPMPSELVDAYQKETIGRVIVEWKDENYSTATGKTATMNEPVENKSLAGESREEQFYSKCRQHMGGMNHNWEVMTLKQADNFDTFATGVGAEKDTTANK